MYGEAQMTQYAPGSRWLFGILSSLCADQALPQSLTAWSGQAQCVIRVQGPGYSHQETQTWTITGPPTQQGAMQVYPGSWTNQGQGAFERSEGRQTLRGQWTTSTIRADAPISVFVRASDGKLLITSAHAQLRSQGAVQGMQTQLFDGIVQSQAAISLEAFEWTIPALQDVPSTSGISGRSSTTVAGSVGPMQPDGSQVVADCGWAFTNGSPQAGCNYAITPTSSTSDWPGTAGAFQLSGPACPWAASSVFGWLQVYPLSGTSGGTLNYTVFPNFTGSDRVGTISVAGKTFTVTQSRNPGTPQRRFIEMLYYSFLNRLPVTTEVAFWEGLLAGGKSREDMVVDFLNSEEFNLTGRFVAGLYVGILNRDAEYGGWLFQRNALTSGIVFPDGLVQNFINGAEFKLKNPVLTDAEYVRLLYRQILLREPLQAEVDFQVGALTSVGRVVLARTFLNGAEFRAGTGPRLMAFLLYSTLLFRDPAATERQSVMTQLWAGVPVKTPVSTILNGAELAYMLR
jgi:hypothetical protein